MEHGTPIFDSIRDSIFRTRRGTSRNYDAIKMSRGIYESLLKELAPIMVYNKPQNTDYPETLMGLQIFVDEEALIDYCVLGYAEAFKSNRSYIYVSKGGVQ